MGRRKRLARDIRRYAPRKLIEIGSGWSSICSIDTIERYGISSGVICIDPYPELLKQLLGKTKLQLQLEVVGVPVQMAPLSVFEALGKDDILFIDLTHVLRTGSDVCFELFEILPRLAPGVLVHFHDMFWPFEYPRSWAVEENRSWNELYAVRAFLTDNEQWEVVFFNDYFAKLERKLIEDTYPNFLRNSGGALWLRRL